jgi:hypothetical protein
MIDERLTEEQLPYSMPRDRVSTVFLIYNPSLYQHYEEFQRPLRPQEPPKVPLTTTSGRGR